MTRTTRSDRNTGAYRAYKGSGVQPARYSRTRVELEADEAKMLRGRGSGTPYLSQRRVVNALKRIEHRQDEERPIGPRPHPRKKGPGRV